MPLPYENATSGDPQAAETQAVQGEDKYDAAPHAHWLTLGADLHPLTVNLVARFARALAAKLAAAEKKYGYTDGWRDAGWMDECRQKLMEHVAKGDPRDVAAYCAFLWHHGESTAVQGEPAASGVQPSAEPVYAESRLLELLPGARYMDPPDGGDVSVMEQLRRMSLDAKRWRAAEAERSAHPAPAEQEGVREALEAQIEQLREDYANAIDGWERCKAECDDLRSTQGDANG